MIKKLFFAFSLFALGLCLNACSNDDGPTQYMTFSDQIIFSQANVVSSNSTVGELVTSTGRVTAKIYASSADLTLTMMVNGTAQEVYLEGLSLSASASTGYKLTASNLPAKDSSGNSLGFNVTSIETILQITDPTSPTHENVLVNCFINGSDLYTATLPTIIHHDTETVTSAGTTSFTCEDAEYAFQLDLTAGTCDIVIKEIQFVQQAPVLSEITIPDVPITQSGYSYVLSAASITPTSSGVPMDTRQITNLNIIVEAYDGEFSGQFECMGMTCVCHGDIEFDND